MNGLSCMLLIVPNFCLSVNVRQVSFSQADISRFSLLQTSHVALKLTQFDSWFFCRGTAEAARRTSGAEEKAGERIPASKR